MYQDDSSDIYIGYIAYIFFKNIAAHDLETKWQVITYLHKKRRAFYSNLSLAYLLPTYFFGLAAIIHYVNRGAIEA